MSTSAEKNAQPDRPSPRSTIGDHNDGQDDTLAEHQGTAKKGFRFWAIIASLLVATFLSALDLTGKFVVGSADSRLRRLAGRSQARGPRGRLHWLPLAIAC